MTRRITTVLLDLDGVIRHFDAEQTAEHFVGVATLQAQLVALGLLS